MMQYNKQLKKYTPLGCISYDEFKNKSGLTNKQASSIWMDFKLKNFEAVDNLLDNINSRSIIKT